MAIRVVGATVGQLIMAPVRVMEAAAGLRSGGRGGIGTGRGGYAGVTIGGAVRQKVAQKVASMRSHSGNQRAAAHSSYATAKMPKNTGGIVGVRSYRKRTKHGRIVEVRGYKRPHRAGKK